MCQGGDGCEVQIVSGGGYRKSVFRFEEKFAKYCGAKYVVSTSYGTDALHFALVALGLERGDEVITAPVSLIATANAVLHAGAVPVFADVELQTYSPNAEEVERKITRRTGTRVVIPVHMHGYPANMDGILEISDHILC